VYQKALNPDLGENLITYSLFHIPPYPKLNSASTLPWYSQCSYTHLKLGPSQWQTANY